MRYLFWSSALLVAYTYLGYPLWLWIRRSWRSAPVRKASILPRVSILIAARNEAKNLAAKFENLGALDYPRDRVEVVVVSDGSTDETAEILSRGTSVPLQAILLASPQGKAVALNRAIAAAKGEIVVFMDARQQVEPDAVKRLVENFADSAVGCVSGELMLGRPGEKSEGLGLYWRIEKAVRKLESDTGSVVGATGALYAIRRHLLPSLPAGLILDDVYLPLCVTRDGRRTIFEPAARAWDDAPRDFVKEYRRKVRTLTGNYELVRIAPWLLGSTNPLRFEVICHKLLRLAVPFALAGLLAGSILISGSFYSLFAAAQIVFYLSAIFAIATPSGGFAGRLGRLALTFLVLNAAAAVAFANFVSGRRPVWAQP